MQWIDQSGLEASVVARGRFDKDGWWISRGWVMPASGQIGAVEPTRRHDPGTLGDLDTEAAILPFLQQAADAAGYPPDRGTQLWILDDGRRGRDAYEPDKLLRRRACSPSDLEWKEGLRLPDLKEL